MLAYTVVAGTVSILAAWIMTVRLFALARRTGQAPEWLLATAFGGLFCAGYPLAGLSRLPGLEGTAEGSLLFSLGATGMAVGIAAMSRFPKIVFRPDTRWASWLCAATALSGCLSAGGCAVAAASSDSFAEMAFRIQPWAIGLMVSLGVPFAWIGLEAFAYYGRMRRRQAIGLARPAATHAFLLWALASWSSVLQIVALVAIRASGQPILAPLPMGLIATCALFAWACWSLAFFMPKAYRTRVLGEGPALPTAGG